MGTPALKGRNRPWPQVILGDDALPHYNGLAALTTAQEQCPEVPFLFVSGTMGEEIAVGTLQLGSKDYVLKDRLKRAACAAPLTKNAPNGPKVSGLGR